MYARNKLLLALVAILPCAFAQAEVERRDLRDFTAIDAAGGVNVDVRIGDEFLVEVDSDENIEDIETEVRNGTLHIDIDRGDWNWDGWQDDYNVIVVMPALNEIQVSGGVDLRVTGTVTGDELDVDVSGGATLNSRWPSTVSTSKPLVAPTSKSPARQTLPTRTAAAAPISTRAISKRKMPSCAPVAVPTLQWR